MQLRARHKYSFTVTTLSILLGYLMAVELRIAKAASVMYVGIEN